jgi:prepilin signal peptidase PulO-like enzyme (type II secretory pathway)
MLLSSFEIVVAAIFGLLFGNYLTTIYSRIKQKKPVNGILKNGLPPHCDSCNHALRYYEYFPVLSWYYTRFQCNYCGVKITPVYFMLEALGLMISICAWYIFGISTFFILFLFCFLSIILTLTLVIC